MRALRHLALAALLATTTVSLAQAADDAFFDINFTDLKITSGELPKPADPVKSAMAIRDGRHDSQWNNTDAWVSLDGPGEAYLSLNGRGAYETWAVTGGTSTFRLLVRAPAGKDVTGVIGFPAWNSAAKNLVRFSIPAAATRDYARLNFYNAKVDYYRHLVEASLPGKPWFQHQVVEAEHEVKKLAPGADFSHSNDFMPPQRASAYDLFSGGRAVSENLQLDRTLREHPPGGAADIDIATLEGITINKIDWKPLLKDVDPKLDPLAKSIPSDQHAVFFPSTAAAVQVCAEGNSREAFLLELPESHSEDNGVLARYELQLGIHLNELEKTIGSAGVKTIALTGSDPYFPTGTDVAVLFETDQPQSLVEKLHDQFQQIAAKQPDVKAETGDVHRVAYQSIRSPDRSVCSYLAALEGAVVLTNSPAQLDRIAQVGAGIDSIATLDEYKFFRSRYPLGDSIESAFVFLSDPTIRRWCSAHWRIASARRTFTAAALTELTADNVRELAADKAPRKTLHTDMALVDAGELTMSGSEVASSTQGTLAWMTPIVEMPIEKVTKDEAEAYNQWRTGYQNGWRWAFDPIGMRLGIADQKLAADITIMPLTAGSEYNHIIAAARGAEIKPGAGDPHDALVRFIMSLNINSAPMQQWGNMASRFAPQAHIEPFSWLGSSVSLYVDDDPIWKKIAAMSAEERQQFQRHFFKELPVAFQAEVASPLKLTIFLTGLRAFIDQTSPGMVIWESLTYRDQPYVRVKTSDQARKTMGNDTDIVVYYAPSGDSFTITLSEAVIKHVIDRRLDREAAEKSNTGEKNSPGMLPWLGSNLCVQVDRKLFELLKQNGVDRFLFDGPGGLSENAMQLRSWSNLPILNEWKRMFPDQDPVAVHQRLWHTTLVSPGGGKYVWNDQWRTMESTDYGQPGQPRSGPKGAEAFDQFQAANFGLTFEDQGLRGRIELIRTPKQGN